MKRSSGMQRAPTADRHRSVLWLWLPLAAYYAIGFAGLAYEPFHQRSIEIINSGAVRNHLETAFIEHIEALLWLFATVFFLIAAIRQGVGKGGFFWLLFFAFICLLALGEETSWGQHYFGFHPGAAIRDLNVQGEFNLHNIHIARMLGLPEDHALYRRLGNATIYLNPLFYFFCILIWLVLPMLLRIARKDGIAGFLKHYPRPGRSFLLSFAFATAVYIAVDLLIFDAGELFELTLATAGCMTGAGSLAR